MPQALSVEEFEMLIRRAQLPLDPAEIAESYAAWQHFEPMLTRIRGERRGREAEPAVMFKPEPLP